MDSSSYNGVQAFRLVSGEDVFGSVTHFDEDKFQDEPYVALGNAAVISMRMDEKTKQPLVGFAPYSPFGEIRDVEIATDKIVMLSLIHI